MKKITLILVALLIVSINGKSQTVVDLGWNWTGTEAIAPSSGVFLEGPAHNSTGAVFQVYPNTENELLVSSIGPDVIYKYWAGDLYAVGQTYGCLQIGRFLPTNYIEVSLTANSANKKIVTARLNGTASEITAGTTFIVLYSDFAPFDEKRIIKYNSTLAFPEARNGGAEISLDVPSGCKSFRIYRKVYIEQTSSNPVLYEIDEWGFTILTGEGNNTRIGYISVTLENDNALNGNIIIDANKTIIKTDFFDMTGKKVSNNYKGLVLIKTTFEDGSYEYMKSLNKVDK